MSNRPMKNKKTIWMAFIAVFLISGYLLTPNAPTHVPLSGLTVQDSIALYDAPDRPTIYVFASLDCDFCKRMHGELERLNGVNVRVFPLPGHTKASRRLAKGAWCASNRSLAWSKAYDKEFAGSATCDDSALVRNLTTAKALGLTGTPTTIFPDGSVVTGYLDSVEIHRRLGDRI